MAQSSVSRLLNGNSKNKSLQRWISVRTPALGAGSLRFESGRPDQFMVFVFNHLEMLVFFAHCPVNLS